MKKGNRLFYSILITLLVGFVIYYLFLPPINIHSEAFWFFAIILITLFGFINFGAGITGIRTKEFDLKNKLNYAPFVAPLNVLYH